MFTKGVCNVYHCKVCSCVVVGCQITDISEKCLTVVDYLANFMPVVKAFSKTKEFLECVGYVLFHPYRLLTGAFRLQ